MEAVNGDCPHLQKEAAMTSRLADNRTFDVAVIGGGIIGAGIARDAAMRGLQVILLDKGDFGCGTTAGSTRLVHGGLRYLEMLDFRLVRMDLRERETLLRIAPHLVKPLQFYMPFYGRGQFFRAKMRIGMMLYDLLSFDKSLPNRSYRSGREFREIEPKLKSEKLQGACGFFDAQANLPERLCMENVLSAEEHGASVLNYAEVTASSRTGRMITGLRVRSVLDGEEGEIRSRLVVNAAGPWADRVGGKIAPGWRARLRTTKGVHIACPPVCRNAMALLSPIDGRLFFVIPWLGYTWIGTTDTDFQEDPGEVRAEAADVRYLIQSAAAYFPELASAPIYFSNAGVRALVTKKGSESSVSRLHKVIDGDREGMTGLVTILGGKITGYRAIAEEVTNLVCRKLEHSQACSTDSALLPGAQNLERVPSPNPAEPKIVDHLRSLYGGRATQVISLAMSADELWEPLAESYPDIAAQVVFGARSELCVRAVDFLQRRTLLGFTPDQGRKAIPKIVHWMARELGWNTARQEQESVACTEWIRQTQEYSGELETAETQDVKKYRKQRL
jgi:glycerol-3-phosphate dehydrogenase